MTIKQINTVNTQILNDNKHFNDALIDLYLKKDIDSTNFINLLK